MNGDALEDWHRYYLPSFFERTRARVITICEEGHQDWPGKSRQSRGRDHHDRRVNAFSTDQVEWSSAGSPTAGEPPSGTGPTQLIDGWNLDPTTGEIMD